MPQPELQHPRHVFRGRLGDGVEHGVAAAGVGQQWKLDAHAIAQLDTMAIAGSPAVSPIFSLGQRRREHAMLHVKHRNMLMNHRLKPAVSSLAMFNEKSPISST